MPESLLSVSEILLYGRVLSDITVEQDASIQVEETAKNERGRESKKTVTKKIETHAEAPGAANLLASALRSRHRPYLARIYAFAYEGHYYDLAKPVIFLVHDKGKAVGGPLDRTGIDNSGIAAAAAEYAEDLRMWR